MGPLCHALGVCPDDVVAFTGGGGKTSLALTLARELTAAGRPPVYTCTTRMVPASGMALVLTESAGTDWPATVQAALRAGEPVCLGRALEAGTGKLWGISLGDVALLKAAAPGVILVEADGSAGLPLKAPAPHEPVIPPEAGLVVPVAGASAFGRRLEPGQVHRAPLVAAGAGVELGAPVTPAVVAAALVGPDGCVRGAPPGARVVPVLGQADTPSDALRETARLLMAHPAVGRVVLAAPATPAPVRDVIGQVSAIVLAAGAARRFGGPKALHPLDGMALIEHSLQAPLRSGLLRDVTVVTGASHGRLAPLLAPYPVRVAHNPGWETGMASSLKAGLRALPPGTEAVLICLGDQPYLPPAVVTRLVQAWRQTGAPVVAPAVGGERRNPVLFSATLLPELLAVQGDEGGRSVVRSHSARLHLVPFDEERWFLDIDRPDDLA